MGIKKNKIGKVVEFDRAGKQADTRRENRREAKAKDLRKRFSAARMDAESPSRAAERLKKLFKQPGPNPGKKS